MCSLLQKTHVAVRLTTPIKRALMLLTGLTLYLLLRSRSQWLPTLTQESMTVGPKHPGCPGNKDALAPTNSHEL